jgi:cell division protein FtsB
MKVRHLVLICVAAWFITNILWAYVYVEDHIAARQAQIEQVQANCGAPVNTQ